MPWVVQDTRLYSRLLCLLFGIQLFYNLLLAICVRLAIQPVVKRSQENMSLDEVGVLLFDGLEQSDCFCRLSLRGEKRSEMVSGVRVTRAHARCSREVRVR